jgi:hypothetical protein
VIAASTCGRLRCRKASRVPEDRVVVAAESSHVYLPFEIVQPLEFAEKIPAALPPEHGKPFGQPLGSSPADVFFSRHPLALHAETASQRADAAAEPAAGVVAVINVLRLAHRHRALPLALGTVRPAADNLRAVPFQQFRYVH